MQTRKIQLLIAIVCGLLTSLSLIAQQHPEVKTTGPSKILVQGIDGKQVSVGATELAKLKRVKAKAVDHGEEYMVEGVALSDVLSLAGVEFGEKLRGKRLMEFVVVDAADDYQAIFALAELDPMFTDKIVLLSDMRDGKPLPKEIGPWRIVAIGEKRQARWVRQVKSLRIMAATVK